MSVLDHKNIDKDVPYFKDVVRYLCSSDCYYIHIRHEEELHSPIR